MAARCGRRKMTDRPQITLSWMRDQDGVIVVYATDADGQKCAVADFWARPLRENLGLERGQAKALQQQLAERLVDSWNGNHRRISTAADAALLISRDRKSTRLNSSYVAISYAVFCLKKK